MVSADAVRIVRDVLGDGAVAAGEAAGAFAVLMIAIYYFSQIFLFGALIVRVYAERYGSMREAS